MKKKIKVQGPNKPKLKDRDSMKKVKKLRDQKYGFSQNE